MLDIKNPAPRAAGRVSNGFVVSQATTQKIAEAPRDLNHFRAAHLAGRARLSPIAAAVVAGLA
jgi:hypothetical protein